MTQSRTSKTHPNCKNMIIKKCNLLALIILFSLIISCEKSDEKDNDYDNESVIDLPTDSPRGLAYDGNYLWYSDDSLDCLYKISEKGDILKTISLSNSDITGFEFYNNHIWCINDTTVFYDTTISHYPFSCIYELSMEGDKLDSVLIQASGNPQKPEFLGLTVFNSNLYGTTNQGYSSHIYKIDLNSKEKLFLQYQYLSGLTVHNDTIYVIDKSQANMDRIVPLDNDCNLIEIKAIEINFQATDLAYFNNHIWVCVSQEKKLKKIK